MESVENENATTLLQEEKCVSPGKSNGKSSASHISTNLSREKVSTSGETKSDSLASMGLKLSHSQEIQKMKKEMDMMRIRHREEQAESTRRELALICKNKLLKIENEALKESLVKEVEKAKLSTKKETTEKYEQIRLEPECWWTVTSLENMQEKNGVLQECLRETKIKLNQKYRYAKTLENWLYLSNDEKIELGKLLNEEKSKSQKFQQELFSLKAELGIPTESVIASNSPSIVELMDNNTSLKDTDEIKQRMQISEKIWNGSFDLQNWMQKFYHKSIAETQDIKEKMQKCCYKNDCRMEENYKSMGKKHRDKFEARRDWFDEQDFPLDEKIRYCLMCYKLKWEEMFTHDDIVSYICKYDVN